MHTPRSLVAAALLLSSPAFANSQGPASSAGQGYTGAPGENGLTCGTCHNGGGFGSVSLAVTSIDADGDGVNAPG